MQRAACFAVLAAVLLACVATTTPPPPAAQVAGPPAVTDDPPSPGPARAPEAPVDCKANDLVVLSDCVIEGEVAIDAHGNCQVTLTNCDLRGSRVAIDAHGNAKVVISGGTISGPTAVDAHGNASVVIEGAAISGVIDQHGDAQVVTN